MLNRWLIYVQTKTSIAIVSPLPSPGNNRACFFLLSLFSKYYHLCCSIHSKQKIIVYIRIRIHKSSTFLSMRSGFIWVGILTFTWIRVSACLLYFQTQCKPILRAHCVGLDCCELTGYYRRYLPC